VEERKYIQSLPRKIDLEYQFKTCGLHTSMGTLVHTFTTLRENGAIIKSIMTKTRILDALYAFAALPKDKYVYTEFVRDAQYPLCIMKDVKHPVLSNPVGNNVSINRDAPQMIITGPNAGGKSTMVKTILINILLSQTIGMAYCRHMTLVPYHCIHTQMNIPDEKGHASLFEAEMHRCKEKLDILQRLSEHHKALFVMDEIFNSTNYVEGVSGAYAIIKRLGTTPSRNTTVIFTTHYGYLTSLETMHPRCFINYRMNVQTSPDFLFPYKLEKGISQQYIALELLKRNGFHNEIVEDALTIKKSVAEASLEMTNNIMGREQT